MKLDSAKIMCPRGGRRAAQSSHRRRWNCATAALASALLLAGCGARTGIPLESGPFGPAPAGTTAIPKNPNQARADKIDLLFVIDDSGSMSDKQAILSSALPDLVNRLVNPLCVDPRTLAPAISQPKKALDRCPEGTLREFNSVQDLHIGVVSTTLGGVGASACGAGVVTFSGNDRARLLGPSSAVGAFLVWDPAQVATPPGIADPAKLETAVRSLVSLGESGCPYEMPLEAMYRFLMAPDPYLDVALEPCASLPSAECAVQRGTDDALLEQRRRFLRHDSLVAIIVLSDENDCSLVAGGESFHVFDPVGSLARASSVCKAAPNDPCCRSCNDPLPKGCRADAECAKGPYPASEDSGLLRCFDQKKRLGVDYLYPVNRYVDGLTRHRVPRRDGTLVDNPLFFDPSGASPPRDPSLVFYASVVGVPWQDLAVDPTDETTLEFKDAATLARDGTFNLILGDEAHSVPPGDPLMIESTEPRTGIQPILKVPLAPPDSTNPLANPINGHESDLGSAPMDLQYACIFDLPEPEATYDCTAFSGSERAICQSPDGTYGSTAFRAKAYPGVRELEVARGVGTHAISASICARNVKDTTRDDYGYRPALREILDRLRVGLN